MSWTSPAVCMLWRVFVPQLPGETHILLGALSSVLTVTPEHLRPTGLGGAWEDKAAFSCPRPGGQSASARWPAGETGSRPCHPLFRLPRTSRFCRDITGQMLLVNSAADVSLAPTPAVQPRPLPWSLPPSRPPSCSHGQSVPHPAARGSF